MISYKPNKIMINEHEVDLATAAHVFYQAKRDKRDSALGTICDSMKDTDYIRIDCKETVEKNITIAKDIYNEMENRYEQFLKEKVCTLDEAHEKGKLLNLDAMILVVLDANYLLKTSEREYLVKLVQKSRASGINLVFMDARPLKDSVVAANIPVVITDN